MATTRIGQLFPMRQLCDGKQDTAVKRSFATHCHSPVDKYATVQSLAMFKFMQPYCPSHLVSFANGMGNS